MKSAYRVSTSNTRFFLRCVSWLLFVAMYLQGASLFAVRLQRLQLDETNTIGAVSLEVFVQVGDRSDSNSWQSADISCTNTIQSAVNCSNAVATASAAFMREALSADAQYNGEDQTYYFPWIFKAVLGTHAASTPNSCDAQAVTAAFSNNLVSTGTVLWKLAPSVRGETNGMPLRVSFNGSIGRGGSSSQVDCDTGISSIQYLADGTTLGPYHSIGYCRYPSGFPDCWSDDNTPTQTMSAVVHLGGTIGVSYELQTIAKTTFPTEGGYIQADIQDDDGAARLWFSVTAEPVFDLAVKAITAPKKVILKGAAPQRRVVKVSIQNRGSGRESIPDTATLNRLVGLSVLPVGTNCPAVAPLLLAPKKFPIVLRPGRTLTVPFQVTFTCANDPRASSKTENHADFRYVVTLHPEALPDNNIDVVAGNDVCPRDPSGTDPGCGDKKPDNSLGADVLTDVVEK